MFHRLLSLIFSVYKIHRSIHGQWPNILLWHSFKDSSCRSFARSFALIRCFMRVRVLREVGLPHYTQISTWHLYLGWVCTCWRVWQCMFGMTESCAPSSSGIPLFELSQLNRCSFWATNCSRNLPGLTLEQSWAGILRSSEEGILKGSAALSQ